MGTKFRTMLAPIGLSTGDGRRFRDGSITLADVPFAFEWVREREGGHDGAVSIGAIQQAKVLSVKDAVADDWIDAASVKGMPPDQMAVWAQGEMFDDVDRERMPQLAEAVATSMHLMSEGTLGPSVDLDSFEAVPVFEGTDEEVSWAEIEAYWEEHGVEPKIELLITEGRVRAATLVSIPAFAETSRPLELIEAEADSEASSETDVLALVASVSAPERPGIDTFTRPTLDGPTPITWDYERGIVFGHIATWQTCHVGYTDVCVTAPRDDEASEYAWFNRFPVETADGTVWAGRITVGGQHAGLSLNASSTMAVYDSKTVAAHVRAYSDDHGIVVAGVIQPGLTGTEIAALNRRKVSGDWRETPGGLSLVEVLALSPGPRAHAEPGFPVPGTFSVNGRQTALTASLGPEPGALATRGTLDLKRAVRAALEDDRAEQAARALAAGAREELAEVLRLETEAERAVLFAVLGEE